MTSNKKLKRRVRERAARTGESYTAALRHLRPAVMVAVAQIDTPTDPREPDAIHRAGRDVRRLMTEAAAAGAHLIQFGEGTLCDPHKRILSSDPSRMAEADWTRYAWEPHAEELAAIARHAQALRLWTVIGGVHRSQDRPRPYNSLFVVDDRGALAARYDERMLSRTKLEYLYVPGTAPTTFSVDGTRFGCALGMESHYPELFLAYERADVDCVLLSTHGPGEVFDVQVRGHAGTNSLWIGYATCAADSAAAPSGVVAPDGTWAARCDPGSSPALALVEIDRNREDHARAWRRTARARLDPR
jgi:predicted amidohydrolase